MTKVRDRVLREKFGKVRALLCNDCNVCVGFLKDKPDIAYKMAKYLEIR